MTERTDVEWETCEVRGCTGIRLTSGVMCLAHCSEEERVAALNLIGETGTIDARGVSFAPALLERVLTAAPRGQNGWALLQKCQFGKATFKGDARFGRVTFSDYATFEQAAFSGTAWFAGATFSGGAGFTDATFHSEAAFDGATFNDEAGFAMATFDGDAGFYGTTFNGEAIFGETTFTGSTIFDHTTFKRGTGFDRAAFKEIADFNNVTFGDYATFEGAAFEGRSSFKHATFDGPAEFGGVVLKGSVMFTSARFGQARQFGPLLASLLVLDEVQFAQRVQIEISSPRISCCRARFPGGVQFRLRWASVVLDDTDLATPSTLAGILQLTDNELAAQEEQIARVWQQESADVISERPQVLSLRQANVAGLGLSSVSVADCRFAGAHNLDKLRLESDVIFATNPMPSALRRWSLDRRQVIAEERAWCAARPRRPRRRRSAPSSDQSDEMRHWVKPRWPVWLNRPEPNVLHPGQIAGLYRELRKGREDAKDEPGAADFYYGEMQMRRHARQPVNTPIDRSTAETSRGRVERGILTAYWLVSGYGLRAWRAAAAFAVVTAALAVAFHLVGFVVPPHPASYWTSLLYAFRATISLTDDDVKLTAWGKLLQGILRLTGPVLLGLTLLALRARVKR